MAIRWVLLNETKKMVIDILKELLDLSEEEKQFLFEFSIGN